MALRALLLVMFVALAAGCRSSLPAPEFMPSAQGLRVVTYNINWGMVNPEAVVAYLRASGADVICLQETHHPWEQRLHSGLGDLYPHTYFHASGGAGGIALLARTPLHDVQVLPATAGWFPALRAAIDSSIGRVQILNVHLRPPLSATGSATVSALYQAPKVHRAELAGFLSAVDRSASLIVAGDFNEDKEAGGAGQLLAQGFTDALSLFDRRTRTWEWPVASNVKIARRYDHLIFNRHLRCTGARVDEVKASDHMPVLAVFTRPAP